MKTGTAALAAFAVMTSAASAADLPTVDIEPQAYIEPAIFLWDGLYIGVSASYGIGKSSATADIDIRRPEYDPKVVQTRDEHIDASVGDWWSGGGLVDAHVGYQYQFGMFVIGAELAGYWSNVDGEDRARIDGPGFADEAHLGTNLNWLATARAKAGIAFDRALLYAIGGVAWGEVENDVGFSASNTRDSISDDWRTTETDVGWTIGLGLEYAVTPNVIVGLEYQHIDLGDDNEVRIHATEEIEIPVSFENEFDLVSAKVSYKF